MSGPIRAECVCLKEAAAKSERLKQNKKTDVFFETLELVNILQGFLSFSHSNRL